MTARPHRALYVALEGIDGVGKSTAQRQIARRLRARGARVRLRREPSDPELGRCAQRASSGDPWASAVYFTIDRFLAAPRLRRDLRRADVVLTDRSFWSTIAYQGSALPSRDRRRLERLQRTATEAPDLVLWLDLPATAGGLRVRARGRPRAPLERQRVQARVARAYRSLGQRRGWIRLDASAPPGEVARRAVDRIWARLPPRAAARA